MPQNLIVINIESMSKILFYHHRTDIPALWSLMNQSASFDRFYSASTSTFMSMADFMQGDSSELDHHMLYPSEAGCLLGRSSNLFCELMRRGYDAHCMRYGTFRDYASEGVDNYLGLHSGSGITTDWFDNHDAYCSAIPRFLQQRNPDKPFALHLLNLVSHVRDECLDKIQAGGLNASFTIGYRLLDKSVGILLNELERLNLLSSTTIVAFGDHGNELWTHGLGKGFMHCTEPYASQCAVPLSIYSSMITPSVTDTLVSMVDLKSTILYMLFPDEPEEKRQSSFSGINILTNGRKMAFSQNLLTLQLEQQDPSRGLIKSYAVTDGIYRVVATSGGDKPKNGGMEFFCDTMDPDNITNLLEFMELNTQGDITMFEPHDARHPHFGANMGGSSIQHMINTYHGLKQALYDFIRAKERIALPNLIGNTYNLFPMKTFGKIRRRRDWHI